MVKICHSFVLIATAHASDDGEAMLQVGKHAPMLAQIDSAVGASRHQQALQMESKFEKLAAEAVRTGATPSLDKNVRVAVNSAMETLEGELVIEKEANDALMVAANDQCAKCNQETNDRFSNKVDAFKSGMEEARSKHAVCRVGDQEDNMGEDKTCGDEKTTCDDQDTYAEEAHDAGPHCTCEEKLSAAAAEKVCLQKAVDWGAEFNTELGVKITACDGAKEVATQIAEECDRDQRLFEVAFCSYEVSLTTTCQSHSACYDAAVLNRGIEMTNLKLKEASEKIMWKSCKKVRCYLDMLDADVVDQQGFDDCKQLKTDTSHLDVVYPAAPAKEDCDTTDVTKYPGDPAWLQEEYAKLAPKKEWLPKRKGIENVLPCLKAGLTPTLESSIAHPQPQEPIRPRISQEQQILGGNGVALPPTQQ